MKGVESCLTKTSAASGANGAAHGALVLAADWEVADIADFGRLLPLRGSLTPTCSRIAFARRGLEPEPTPKFSPADNPYWPKSIP